MLSAFSGVFTSRLWTTLILCAFGFFREMRPNESYAAEYITAWRNLTAEELNKDLYPLATYSNLTQLIIVFLITDMLRYKPIIVASAICGAGCIVSLLWTYTYTGLLFGQLFYGFFSSSEVAYYTYMYAKVDKSMYEKVTGQTRSAILFGRFTAGISAQFLVTYKLMDFRELHYISFSCQIISFILAILLPRVGTSLYFFAKPKTDKIAASTLNDAKLEQAEKDKVAIVGARTPSSQEHHRNDDTGIIKTLKSSEKTEGTFSIRYAALLMRSHIRTAYTNKTVICWSVWWSLATAAFLFVFIYVQILWKSKAGVSSYNGAVEGVQTLSSALGAYSAGFISSERAHKHSYLILTVVSFIEGGVLMSAGLTDSIWVAYVVYIIFCSIYNFIITIATAVVAKELPEDSFALIFGINTLFALITQSILTIGVISDTGLALPPNEQYIAFGFYFVALALCYAMMMLVSKVKSLRKKVYSVNT